MWRYRRTIYGKLVIHYSHEPNIIIQCMHKGTNSIDRPSDDPGETQGGMGKVETAGIAREGPPDPLCS